MTRIAIDQILQVGSPTRSAADSPKSNSTDDARFREHLQRATTSEKTDAPTRTQENQAADDDSDLALTTGQEQDASLEQSDTPTPPVEGEKTVEQTTAEPEGTVDADDVVISSAAVAAVEEIVVSAINTDVETETTAIAALDVAAGIPETDSIATPLTNGEGTATFDENQVDEIAAHEPKKDPLLDADVAAQTDLLATSEITSDSIAAVEIPQNSADTQEIVQENASTQSFTNSTNQQGLGDGTSQQQTDVIEVEPSTEAIESAPKAQEESTGGPPNLLEMSDQEISTINTEAESAQVTNATATETNRVDASANNEATFAISKPQDTSSVEQSQTATEARAEADATPTVNRTRFIQRVSGAFRAAKDENGLVQIKLSPPELGTLRIEITVKQGVLTAQLETETAAARNVLLDNLPALRDRLAEQEIRIEKFNVDVRDEGRQQQENPGAEDRGSSNHSSNKETGRTANRNENQSRAPSTPNIISQPSGHLDGLDVMI